MARVYSSFDLEWRGDALCRVGSRTPIVTIVPDDRYPQMWRVRRPDGSLTDMLNITWARDAARSFALALLNGNKQSRLAGLARKLEAGGDDHLDGAQPHQQVLSGQQNIDEVGTSCTNSTG
jgi:hypothetical protein